MNRGALIKQLLTRFIFKKDQDIYYLHRKKLFETGEPQRCELRLVKPDGSVFWAHLTETVAQAADGAPECRIVFSDITERKLAEEQLQQTMDRSIGITANCPYGNMEAEFSYERGGVVGGTLQNVWF
ncbi:MAG: PAS domain S-box protein [Actinomycetota bacterium]|nr:PAS domain S-box protein [Actinomycetota bacterium]